MTSSKFFLLIFFLTVFIVSEARTSDDRTKYFPKAEKKPVNIPNKEDVWVFILAGQSNMAGRGFVEPQDTIPNKRIYTINKDGELIFAKEPLNFNEPNMAGLDCGLSFGRELLNHIPDTISVLLIHTAVGGTSISQWNNDSTFRNVTLLSNFREKVKTGQTYGTIKGILWHQVESDATTAENIELYQSRLGILFGKFRQAAGDQSLPILIGELGSFSRNYDKWQAVNRQIYKYIKTDSNSQLISTQDFDHKGDKVHFNSEGQREMGKRFAEAFVNCKQIVENEMKPIEDSVVISMDGSDAELFTFLPYILQDLWEIGSDPDIIVKVVRRHFDNCRNLKVLDLGCGKGAVSVKLSNQLECFCHGIDAIPEFIDYARGKAKEYGVQHLCTFETGDIRTKVKNLSGYDIIILGSIGPVFGDYHTTLTTLSGCINRNGAFIIDDGYTDDKSDYRRPDIFEHSTVIQQIEKAGMYIVEEDIMDREVIKASDQFIYEKLKNRCFELIDQYPEKQELFLDYIKRQEIENDVLENKVITSTMVIKIKHGK